MIMKYRECGASLSIYSRFTLKNYLDECLLLVSIEMGGKGGAFQTVLRQFQGEACRHSCPYGVRHHHLAE